MRPLLELLFGCAHRDYTWPTRLRNQRHPVQNVTGCYIVCLECGREMPYSWNLMKVVPYERRQPITQPPLPVPLLERFPQPPQK